MEPLFPIANETSEMYFERLSQNKEDYCITWGDIATLMERHFYIEKTPNAWCKKYNKLRTSTEESAIDEQIRFEIEKIKLSDQRTAIRRDIRSISREQTLIEIANDAAKIIRESGRFLSNNRTLPMASQDKVGILLISDWHYGLVIENFYNHFSPEICKDRVSQLRDNTFEIIKKENLKKIIVINLGDMVAGIIHDSIRFNSRVDVITQVIEVSTLIAEFLDDLSSKVNIEYYDTLDNHSRIDKNKDETTKLCQLSRVTAPYLKAILQNNKRIVIHQNNDLSESIILFDLFNKYKVAGTHGDKDKPGKAINNITGYSQQHIDLLLMAHRHHFSADEQNFTMMYCNGSLMGTDDFAESLRLSSTPSQTLIISSEDNVAECVYVIKLK